MSSLPSIIREHSPLRIDNWTGLAVVAFGMIYGVLLFAVPLRQFRVVWLLPVVWFALACMRIRHAPLFSVVALIAIADLFPFTWIAGSLIARKSDLFAPTEVDDESIREQAIPFAVPAGLVVLALLVQAIGWSVPVIGRGWARLDPGSGRLMFYPNCANINWTGPAAPHLLRICLWRVHHLPRSALPSVHRRSL